MANFQISAITENGVQLKSHVDVGAVFTATRIVIGSGYIPNGKTAKTMTDVVTPVKELPINKKERSPDGRVVFGGVYTNEGVTAEFYFRELALYAKAVYPNGTEVDEVLYCYLNAAESAELMAAYSTGTVVERQMDIVTYIGNEAQVDLTIQSGLYLAHAAKHAAGGEDPVTCDMIGAVKKSGDTMTGDLNQRISGGEGKLTANAYRMAMRHTPNISVPDEYSLLGVFGDSALKDAVQLWRKENGVEENYKIIHTGNKDLIKPSDIGAVGKTGDQTMTGSLSGRAFLVSDGYMKGDYGVDGALKRVEIRAIDPSNGAMGALLVNPSGLLFMDGGGYEYRVVHEGNLAQFLGVAPATVE